ncbi:MAG TPA: adenylate/guanylate cyclase domain-containing protein [Myxococcota bacterium]|jgi:class 3 adenylate cyclase|nr:adenylate/guanylate cyclase domain-containing protein [Myxococcota bacterium]
MSEAAVLPGPLPGTAIVAELRRHVAAPPLLVWALAGDTNRWDRLVGFSPTTYRTEPVTGDAPPAMGGPAPESGMRRVGHAQIAGWDVSWVERGEWIEGDFLRGERHFVTGPMVTGGLLVRTSAAEGGTLVEASTWSVPRSELPRGVQEAIRGSLARSLERFLDAIARVLTAAPAPAAAAGLRAEPAATSARRVVLAAAPDAVTSGAATPAAAEEHFAYCAGRLASAPVEPVVRERMLAFLRSRGDDELRQIRPYEVARAWELDRRGVLSGFLHAARAGLVDLRWQINCPTCRVGAASAEGLDSVGKRVHCDTCDIDFDVDFAANVEAVFQVNGAIRPVQPAVYCAGSPWFRPHVFAMLVVAPRATREVTLSFPPTVLAVRRLGGRRLVPLPGTPAAPGTLDVRVRADEPDVVARGAAVVDADGTSRTRLRLQNDSAAEAVLLVEWVERDADLALGSEIMSLPEFGDLFAAEAPATGANLTVGAMTMVFTDLSGTTALYRRIGDARAFALVQAHFREMTAVAAANDGIVVKTMGDAIMAAFADPARAMAAALEMVARTRRAFAAHDVRLKVGLHVGPCLAVRANGRLDFFGTTVNVAARLQAAARPDQILVAADLLAHAGVERLVRERALVLAHYQADLKGLTDEMQVLSLDA